MKQTYKSTWVNGLLISDVPHVAEVRGDDHAQARVDDEDEEEEGHWQVDRDCDGPVLLGKEGDPERLLKSIFFLN